MEITEVEYKKNRRTGEEEVLYSCPRCNAELVTLIQEIQSEDKCPDCSVMFVFSEEAKILIENERRAALIAEEKVQARNAERMQQRSQNKEDFLSLLMSFRKTFLVVVACLVGILVWFGAIVAAYTYRQQIQESLAGVVDAASETTKSTTEVVTDVIENATPEVPSMPGLIIGREITKDEVDRVVRSTELNDISSETVNQQLATYARGVMRMSELVALAVGAKESSVSAVNSSVSLSEIGADNVYQQKAIYYKATFELLELAAQASGAGETDLKAIHTSTEIADISTDTIHQQCANYCMASVKYAALLAKALAVEVSKIESAKSSVSLAEISANTVFQQIVCRLQGLVEILELAAIARGANKNLVNDAMTTLRIAEISSNTVYQQEVNYLKGAMTLLGLIATG